MKKVITTISFYCLLILISCQSRQRTVTLAAINLINLKQGEVVLCGPVDKQLGSVGFEISCSENVKKDFNLGLALLHSFEYEEAEKVFAKIIYADPGCAMAYWGVAMCNYHQLWPSPPTPSELEKGLRAITLAQGITYTSPKESAFIDAMAVFYKNWEHKDHHTRNLLFEKEMEKVHLSFPDDIEAAVFYALALDGSADPADKSYINQRKAGDILNALYPTHPDHPGIVHYLIHTYDNPELANLALPAARKYASIAPSSAHAQHMPSHIYTRLGYWDESIASNLNSIASARCYAENAGIKGHWDEELHGMDYLVYAYLQKGDNKRAQDQNDSLQGMLEVFPSNFKVAYSFAAIPARYVLENKMWLEAANLNSYPPHFNWEMFPWQNAILHFARALGNAHLGRLDSAKVEINQLRKMRDSLIAAKDSYKANQVWIQMEISESWWLFNSGKQNEGLSRMKQATEMEEKTEKSPVTPGEVLPARELLGEMLILMNQYPEALAAFEADLKNHPNRFNGLFGAGLAAEKSKQNKKAITYYNQLINIADANSTRPELVHARMFLDKSKKQI